MSERINSVRKGFALGAIVIGLTVSLVGPRLLRGQGQMTARPSLSNWRPTQEYPGVQYVGSSVCAQCHTFESATFSATPMAHALETPSRCEVLLKHPRLTFRNGEYSYQITSKGTQRIYTVTDGVTTISEPILYCFGQGVTGQTYVLRHKGTIYESRISYFQALRNLDFTVGQTRLVPTSVEDAVGRPVGLNEIKECFSCHSAGAVSKSQLQLDGLVPGVSCEACHGPGEKHLAAVRAKNFKDLQIFNPANLSAHELSQEFCGACHISFDTAMLLPGQGGMNNIRFQAYRIFNSPGHNKIDDRVSCVACHNPHEQLKQEASFYDSKCLACHLTSPGEARTVRRTAAACPVSTKNCVTCHMPKVEIPGMHFGFTDHWIRIARPGDPVPH
jgi:Cytochrome c554 and c-prime